jgi:hypothetical protein
MEGRHSAQERQRARRCAEQHELELDTISAPRGSVIYDRSRVGSSG